MQDAVPPKVLELSERNQLGEFVRCHRGPTFVSIMHSNGKSFRVSLYDIINACVLRALLLSILSPSRDILHQQAQIAE